MATTTTVRNSDGQKPATMLKQESENVKVSKAKQLLQGECKMKRASLQTLQPTTGSGLTRPGDMDQKSKSAKKSGKIEVYLDPEPAPSVDEQSECSCRCHQKEAEDEAHKLLGQEEVPEDYWKELAEERRLALSDSLAENKSLHEKIDELEEENSRLLEIASHADYFAKMVEELTGGSNEEEEARPEVTGGE